MPKNSLSGSPLPVYDSATIGSSVIAEAKALWKFRSLAIELAARDIRVRYKRSVLGVAWTMLTPLLNMIALTLVFSEIMRAAIKNFPVFYLSGAIIWTFFSQVTSHAASMSIDALEISKRSYVPRSVFVVAAIAVGLYHLILSLVPFLAIVLATGASVHLSFLFLPVSILIATVFTAGVSLLVFTYSLRFADVRETYLVLVSTLFFFTPIVFTTDIVPKKYLGILMLNPLVPIVEIFRAPLYGGVIPEPATLLRASGLALFALIAGWAAYALLNEDYAARS